MSENRIQLRSLKAFMYDIEFKIFQCPTFTTVEFKEHLLVLNRVSMHDILTIAACGMM